MDDIQLTNNFWLSEFLVSQTATREGIDNTPSDSVLVSLQRMAETMEKIRKILATPILINSGYRSPALNKRIGGVVNSSHLSGLAVDFISPRAGSPLQVCKKLQPYVHELSLDQLIYEQSWIHVALAEGIKVPRYQVLTYQPGVGYSNGLP